MSSAELKRHISQSSTATVQSLRDSIRDVEDLQSLEEFCVGSELANAFAPEILVFLRKMFLCEQLRRHTLDHIEWPAWPVPRWTAESHAASAMYAMSLAETSFTLTGGAQAFVFDLAKQVVAWAFFRLSTLEHENDTWTRDS